MSKYVVVVGNKGQDGQLLETSLLRKGLNVVGINRDGAFIRGHRIDDFGHSFSVLKKQHTDWLVKSFRPTEIYYLAGYHCSSEAISSMDDHLEYTYSHSVNVYGLVNCLSGIRAYSPKTRLFYASSSLVFSGDESSVQSESTPFSPSGFYGITKAIGISVCREYRESFGVFAASGILYNHESVLRKDSFASMKIIKAAYRISKGLQSGLTLGSMRAEVDWGYAPDFVEAFQAILALDVAEDFIVSTNDSHSIEEFCSIAFACAGLEYKKYVNVEESLLTRAPRKRVGDNRKLRLMTNWSPSVNFSTMVKRIYSDYEQLASSSGQ